MKHILFFNDSMEMGGTEKLLVGLLNHLVTQDYAITLLLPIRSDRNILLRDLSWRVPVKYIYDDNTSHLKKKLGENLMVFFPRLFAKWRGLKAADYDQIICFKETFFARIFSKMNLPKILWIHNILYKRKYEADTPREKFSVWLNKKQIKKVQRSYDSFDKVICVSDAARNAYLSVLHNGQTPPQDISVLYNAVDLSAVTEKAKEKIEDLPQGRTNFILLTRTSPEKRTDRLINAAQRLHDEGYNFHIYIIGEGMNSREMQETVASLNLADNITLMGRTENPFPYVLQCNWSLCVSERESFSLVLLESMALKTPVITTDCGGPHDIVDGGRYGILADNSAEGVYQGMKMVLDDPTLSVKYSAGLDKAVARFDYQGWLKKVEKLLINN
ncbi:glycosyltransferase [Dysgonomonas sp. 521]|uniref:glycosyltransferase n=1 Tax=Dysgonomonas sp. 521 TaxID=2302932 RepID=UPI0013D8B6B3|nr:glycosyltransferase [Dysgonomonas sp. 521]NDV95004.1 glycosyltransferase [Dysgonomonas sp. 521]